MEYKKGILVFHRTTSHPISIPFESSKPNNAAAAEILPHFMPLSSRHGPRGKAVSQMCATTPFQDRHSTHEEPPVHIEPPNLIANLVIRYHPQVNLREGQGRKKIFKARRRCHLQFLRTISGVSESHLCCCHQKRQQVEIKARFR